MKKSIYLRWISHHVGLIALIISLVGGAFASSFALASQIFFRKLGFTSDDVLNGISPRGFIPSPLFFYYAGIMALIMLAWLTWVVVTFHVVTACMERLERNGRASILQIEFERRNMLRFFLMAILTAVAFFVLAIPPVMADDAATGVQHGEGVSGIGSVGLLTHDTSYVGTSTSNQVDGHHCVFYLGNNGTNALLYDATIQQPMIVNTPSLMLRSDVPSPCITLQITAPNTDPHVSSWVGTVVIMVLAIIPTIWGSVLLWMGRRLPPWRRRLVRTRLYAYALVSLSFGVSTLAIFTSLNPNFIFLAAIALISFVGLNRETLARNIE